MRSMVGKGRENRENRKNREDREDCEDRVVSTEVPFPREPRTEVSFVFPIAEFGCPH